MSLAENLLNSLDETAYENMRIAGSGEEEHIIVGQDRSITVPNALKTIAVKGDNDVETVTFDCVRYWDGNDLSTFAIYLNYVLPDLTTGTYIPEKITTTDGDEFYHFDWQIKNNITVKSGKISFAVTAVKTKQNENGETVVDKQWSSIPNSDCSIVPGLDISNVPSEEESSDVLAQMSAILGQIQEDFDEWLKNNLPISQTTGESETAVMSQKATTENMGYGGIKTITPNYTKGKYIFPWGGTTVSNRTGYKLSESFFVSKGTKIIVKAAGIDNNLTVIAKTDESSTEYKYLVNSIDSTYRTYEYVTTEDMYIAVSGSASENEPIVVTTVEKYVEYDIGNKQVTNDIFSYLTNVTDTTILDDFDNAERNRAYLISITDIANIPEQSVGTLMCIGYSNSYRLQMYSTFTGHLYYRQSKGPEGWNSWTCLGSEFNDYACISLFEKVGIIGDSYASGQVFANNNTALGTFYNLSWGQIMARRNGITVQNYSEGGLSTRTWLTSNMGLPKMLKSETDNLYVLALGINDRYHLGVEYLGTESDMTDDYTQNPDTFYGNYARIIENVKIKNPTAKLVISSLPFNDTESHQAFNGAIVNIAKHYGIPSIVLYNDEFIKSPYFSDRMVGGHPVAITYSGMAKAYERLIEKCVHENYEYFKDYIG